MEIKFLLRSGKIVDNPFQFKKERTDQNFPYYYRLKALQLYKPLIEFIEKYREENNINAKELRETFFIPFMKEIQENLVRLVNYEEELYEALLEKNIDAKKLQNLLKEKFKDLSFYKRYSKSFNEMPLVELLLFGVIRVVPGKPLIDITREYDENGPSVHIHIRNNVGITDIRRFIKDNYEKKIAKTLDREGVNTKDKMRRNKRDLEILRLYTKGELSLNDIGTELEVEPRRPGVEHKYSEEDIVKTALARLRKLNKE